MTTASGGTGCDLDSTRETAAVIDALTDSVMAAMFRALRDAGP